MRTFCHVLALLVLLVLTIAMIAAIEGKIRERSTWDFDRGYRQGWKDCSTPLDGEVSYPVYKKERYGKESR